MFVLIVAQQYVSPFAVSTKAEANEFAKVAAKRYGKTVQVKALPWCVAAPSKCNGCGEPVLDGDFDYCSQCVWEGTSDCREGSCGGCLNCMTEYPY